MLGSNQSVCGINPDTGFCESCSCFSGRNKDTGEWFCVALEHERANEFDRRNEDSFSSVDNPEQELEFHE